MTRKFFQRLLKSAEGGDPIAQYELAACYHSGRGVEKNPEKTLHFLKEAADRGFKPAEKALYLLQVKNEPVFESMDSISENTHIGSDKILKRGLSNSEIRNLVRFSTFIWHVLAGILSLGIFWFWQKWSYRRWEILLLQSINEKLDSLNLPNNSDKRNQPDDE